MSAIRQKEVIVSLFKRLWSSLPATETEAKPAVPSDPIAEATWPARDRRLRRPREPQQVWAVRPA